MEVVSISFFYLVEATKRQAGEHDRRTAGEEANKRSSMIGIPISNLEANEAHAVRIDSYVRKLTHLLRHRIRHQRRQRPTRNT